MTTRVGNNYSNRISLPKENTTNHNANEDEAKRKTPYEKLSFDLSNDQRCLKEITLGKRIGFYRIRGELGTGNFSQVKMGIHALTKEKVAIKILDKTKLDPKTQRLLSREISSMEKLHHPNIIRLYEVVETLAKLYLVMEYASGGELFNRINADGRIPECDAKTIFAQVVAAVTHMHDHHIIHRDIKAENVFYAGVNFVKIGDFGFSTYCTSDQTLNTFCGSPPYAAPELFRDQSYYGIFVDIWALGIMLFFTVTGVMPFRAETVGKLKKYILDGTYSIPSYVSDSCQFLIRGILKPQSVDRLTLKEIRNSEWLEGQEFPEGLSQYQINPSENSQELMAEEEEARDILKDLGIGDEHMKQCADRSSRSSITGTYRIVLHQVHKRSLNLGDMPPESGPQEIAYKNANSRPPMSKKQSKFCTIL